MCRLLKLAGTATGIVGATIIAFNLPSSIWGFVLFPVSPLSWGAAVMMRKPSLFILQGVFTAINVVGNWRWLVV